MVDHLDKRKASNSGHRSAVHMFNTQTRVSILVRLKIKIKQAHSHTSFEGCSDGILLGTADGISLGDEDSPFEGEG